MTRERVESSFFIMKVGLICEIVRVEFGSELLEKYVISMLNDDSDGRNVSYYHAIDVNADDLAFSIGTSGV